MADPVLDTQTTTGDPVFSAQTSTEENVDFTQLTSTSSSITLNWNSVSAALGYQIEYGPSVEGEQGQHGPYEIIDVGDVTQHTINDLDSGQTYDVRIRYYE